MANKLELMVSERRKICSEMKFWGEAPQGIRSGPLLESSFSLRVQTSVMLVIWTQRFPAWPLRELRVFLDALVENLHFIKTANVAQMRLINCLASKGYDGPKWRLYPKETKGRWRSPRWSVKLSALSGCVQLIGSLKSSHDFIITSVGLRKAKQNYQY